MMGTLKRWLRGKLEFLTEFGLDPFKFLSALRGLPTFLSERRRFRNAFRALSPNTAIRTVPCLHDRKMLSGAAEGHYFHQDLHVARRIFLANPETHFDVGSRIDGFVAHVAVFRNITVLDIRPNQSNIGNIRFCEADLMAEMPPHLVSCCDSLSCLHALEHFGLGRYGDPIDASGHERGLANLHRMLTPGGTLYLSVPIGPDRVEFNSQRVFSIQSMLDLLCDRFDLDAFSFVDDTGALNESVAMTDTAIASNFGCAYGCGIFELTKRSP